MQRVFAWLLAAAAFTGCSSIQPARMALPPALESGAERIEIKGLGAAPRGRFEIGSERGTFTRSASRLALFDALYEGDSAVASWVLNGSTTSSGRCEMKRRTANLGVLTYEFKPMEYRCEFTGTVTPARLEVREAASTGRVQPMRRERSGEMVYGEVRLQLRSAHALAGTRLQSAAPIGYLFQRDSRVLAAVEINGTQPVIVLAPENTAGERRAVALASLALALLWDPKETGLDD